MMLGKIEGKRRRGRQRITWLDSIANSMDMSLSKCKEIVEDREPGMLQSIGLQSRTGPMTEQQHFNPICEVPFPLCGNMSRF